VQRSNANDKCAGLYLKILGCFISIRSRNSNTATLRFSSDGNSLLRSANRVRVACLAQLINVIARKVVDERGYFPNTQARALVSGRSRIFGLIVSDISNPFFPEIVQTFEHLAVENNYEILLTSTINDTKRMEQSVRRMTERRVDGVAILTFGMEESLLGHLRFRKVPLVFVDVGPDAPGIVNIRINYLDGIRQAVQHLAALRHTRIAFVAGPPRLKSAQARVDAFNISMAEIGLPPDLIASGDHTVEGGMRALVELLELQDRPTALVCSK
jgi:LacI family transcriptional regulator